MKSSTKYLKISLNICGMIILILFCFWLLPKLLVYFMPFVIAGIIACIANPIVRFLEKKIKLKRKAGSAFVIILVLAAVVFACYELISLLIREIIGFAENAPAVWKSVSETIRKTGESISSAFGRLPQSAQDWLESVGDSIIESLSTWISTLGERVANVAGNTASNIPLMIVSVIMCILACYLFVAERDYLAAIAGKFLPQSVTERMEVVRNSMKTAVGGYFKAQFKIMGVVYVIIFAGLLILRVKYAFLIALLIAFMDFLPFFGTGTIMWPWAVIAFLQDNYFMAVGLMIVWAISQLVRQFIQPKLLSTSVGMPAIPTLLLLYVGFRLGGAIGLIIAVPIGMIVINLYKAGMFSNFVYGIKILAKDLAKRRVFTHDELVSEGIITDDDTKEDSKDDFDFCKRK